MRVLMGRSGIWAFLILMATFVTVLAASTPVFERLMGLRAHKRGDDYLPGPKQLVKPGGDLREGESPPVLPQGPEPAVEAPASPPDERTLRPPPRVQTPMAAHRPAPGYRAAMTDMARTYFDLGADLGKGRERFTSSLARMRQRRYDLLGDPEWLMHVVYGARSFLPCMTDRRWQQADEIDRVETEDRFVTVRTRSIDLGFHPPESYGMGPYNQRRMARRDPRPGPWPVLISTLEPQDARAVDDPARHHFDRRYRKPDWSDFNADWFTLVPVASGARYVEADGRSLRRDDLIAPFLTFGKHYHVDFERVVLHGGQEALLAATIQPFMFAGIALRGGELDEDLVRLVSNFAHTPVFVHAEQVELGRALRAAGHANVTSGDDRTLRGWMRRLRRTTPRAFRWRVLGPQHQFAHWINIESLSPDALEHRIAVAVDGARNEIRIDALGIERLSLFLNDEIVDLDRIVRVVINDGPALEKRLVRSLDTAMSRDPLMLRDTMYFGLVFPARWVNLAVAHPPAAEVDRR